jgi:methionyl-tRNA formyltransferase
MTIMTTVVFMGTPEFAVPSLQTLIEHTNVVGVVTQPDKPAGRGKKMRPSPVKVVAENAGIPLYQPHSLRAIESAQPIRNWQPDIIVVAAFGQILRPHLLELPPHGCLNVHASLLPRWRGASPIQHAILSGDADSGVSLMQMDKGLDTGAVYVKEAIPLAPDETAATLHDKLAQLGAEMMAKYLGGIIAGIYSPTPQDNTHTTYAPIIKKEDGQLDWQKSARELDQHIRAFTPWPSTFTHWEGNLLKVLAADVSPIVGEPGLIIQNDDNIMVGTGHGSLILRQVQLAGKKATDILDFMRGRPNFIGARL